MPSPRACSSWRSSTRSRRRASPHSRIACSTGTTTRRARDGRPRLPSVNAEVLHFLGEVEVVFGLWAVVLLAAITAYAGWESAKHYFSDTVNYTEPLFVVVIMALAATRPVIGFAEAALRRVASAGGATPAAWWVTILTIGPVLGSFITEPAAMTICALLLGTAVLRPAALDAPEVRDAGPAVRQRVDRRDADALRRAAGVDGGAAVGMGHPVHARAFRLAGASSPSSMSTAIYFMLFRRELQGLAARPPVPEVEHPRRGGGRAAAGAALGGRRAPGVHGVDRVHRALSRRCSSAASCSSWASPAPPPPIRAASS